MKKIYIFGILAVMLSSCSKMEQQADVQEQNVVTGDQMEIAVSSGDDSKTSLSGSSVLWTAGDKLKVFVGTSSTAYEFALGAGAGTTSGKFYGPTISGSTYYAAYPASAVTYSSSTFTFTLPSTVKYNAGTFDNGSSPMLATGSDVKSMAMKNLCGVIRFQFTGTMEVNQLEFTFSNYVSGQGTVSTSNPTTLSMKNTASKAITMTFDSPVQLGTTAKDFYLAVPAGFYSSLSIKAIQTDGGFTTKNVGSFTVTRSAVATMQGEILSASRPQIKTCSFNILEQSEDDTYPDHTWDSRKSAVYEFLNSESFDVFCLQECEYRQRTEILNNVSGYAAYGKGTQLGNESSSGNGFTTRGDRVYNNQDAENAVFYKTELYEIVDNTKGTFWLNEGAPTSPSIYEQSRHYHTCSWVKLRHMSTGIEFYVFNTHLENGSSKTTVDWKTYDPEEARKYEMPILYNKLCEINSEGLPMLVYGDFNGSTTDIWGYCEASKTGWYWARNQDSKTSKTDYPGSCNNWRHWPDNTNPANYDHIAYKNFYDSLTGGKHGMVKGSFTTYIGHNESKISYTCPWIDTGVEFISDHWPIAATFVFDWQNN